MIQLDHPNRLRWYGAALAVLGLTLVWLARPQPFNLSSLPSATEDHRKPPTTLDRRSPRFASNSLDCQVRRPITLGGVSFNSSAARPSGAPRADPDDAARRAELRALLHEQAEILRGRAGAPDALGCLRALGQGLARRDRDGLLSIARTADDPHVRLLAWDLWSRLPGATAEVLGHALAGPQPSWLRAALARHLRRLAGSRGADVLVDVLAGCRDPVLVPELQGAGPPADPRALLALAGSPPASVPAPRPTDALQAAVLGCLRQWASSSTHRGRLAHALAASPAWSAALLDTERPVEAGADPAAIARDPRRSDAERVAAVGALVDAPRELTALLDESDSTAVRREAVARLARQHGDAARDRLRRASELDPAAAVRARATLALRPAEPRDHQRLLQAMSGDPSSVVRAAAADRLAAAQHSRQLIARLGDGLASESPIAALARVRALWVLTRRAGAPLPAPARERLAALAGGADRVLAGRARQLMSVIGGF